MMEVQGPARYEGRRSGASPPVSLVRQGVTRRRRRRRRRKKRKKKKK